MFPSARKLIGVGDSKNRPHTVAGDEQFFVGGNDADLDRAACCTDDAFRTRNACIGLPVDVDSKKIQAFAASETNEWSVLSDASSKNQPIDFPQNTAVGRDVLPDAIGKNVDC